MLSSSENATDFVTVLAALGGKRSAKLYVDPSQPPHDYDAGLRFNVGVQPVSNLDELAAALETLRGAWHCFAIRGRLKDGAPATNVFRRIHDRNDGNGAPFEAAAHRWIMLDADSTSTPFVANDPVGSVARWRATLPVGLRDAALVFQFSAKQHLNATVRGHAWFWLDAPIGDVQAAAWSDANGFDPSLFNPVQPHYTADPIFYGCADPLAPRALVRLPGTVAHIDPPPVNERDDGPREPRVVGAEDLDPASPAGQCFKAWLAWRLRDARMPEGGVGSHRLIWRVTGGLLHEGYTVASVLEFMSTVVDENIDVARVDNLLQAVRTPCDAFEAGQPVGGWRKAVEDHGVLTWAEVETIRRTLNTPKVRRQAIEATSDAAVAAAIVAGGEAGLRRAHAANDLAPTALVQRELISREELLKIAKSWSHGRSAPRLQRLGRTLKRALDGITLAADAAASRESALELADALAEKFETASAEDLGSQLGRSFPELAPAFVARLKEQQGEWQHRRAQRAARASENAEKRTDLGNARRLVRMAGSNLRYFTARDTWYAWDGVRWVPDETNAGIMLAAKAAAESLLAEASAEADEDEAAAARAWAEECQNRGRLVNMVELAKTEPQIPVTADALDADPWLLNTANGVLDLRTGQLSAPTREMLMTKVTAAPYVAGARSDLWDSFIRRTTGGDGELAAYIQRALGYSLLGVWREKMFWFGYGPPDGAKSTLLGVVGDVLGSYHVSADASTWMVQSSSGGNRGDVTRLLGARLVTTLEVRASAKFDQQIMKKVTGGDSLVAAAKYEAELEFRPTFALWFGANDRPIIPDDDAGFWNRVRCVPFTHTVPAAEQDKALREKLAGDEHAPAVLAWLVAGFFAYQREGMGTCRAVDAATNEYRRAMNQAADFFDEHCDFTGDPSDTVPAWQLRGVYKGWCEENGVRHPLAGKAWSTRLRALGVTGGDDASRIHGQRHWYGVRLKRIAQGADSDKPRAA